jgi:transcriptional regulator GlxA family with amidase domain
MAAIFDQEWEVLAEEARFNARNLARLCNVSVRQLQRVFRRRFSSSPQLWLNEQRMASARELLLAGHSVKQVTFELSFKQPSHFCRIFKSFNQLTPSEFVSIRTMTDRECRR